MTRELRFALRRLWKREEECRERSGVAALDTTLQDFRYGLRGLRRAPIFTVTALLTLALSIGGVSTVLTLAHTYFFQRLPVEHPEAVIAVSATRRHGTALGSVSYPDYARFRDQNHTLKGLAAHYSTAPLFLAVRGEAREINGAVVSANFFPVLGVKPALGRFFGPEEDRVPDRDHVAVLGHDLWRDWFSSSPDALGATLGINGVPFTIIGVAPSTFPGVSNSPSQIYIPTMMLRVGYRFCRDSLSENCTILDMIGRLADGHRLEETMAEMTTLMPPRWARASDGDNSGVAVFFPRVIHHDDSEVRFVQLLSIVAGVLLVVGCANLAGLLIARGSARAREFAIRTSLGASNSRLVRQLLTEAVLVAVIGGVFGVLLSLGMTGLLNSMFYSVDSEGHPLYFNFRLEPSVVFVALAVSILAGVLFGLLPALKAIRTGAAESLKRESSSVSSRSRLARWLVGAQAAIAVTLVVVAMLLSASARTVVNGANFESSHVALLRLRPGLIRYPSAKAQQFQRAVIRRLAAMPDVESVSLIGTGAIVLGGKSTVSLASWTEAVGNQTSLEVGYGEIAPRYFETLRTPMLVGRDFNDRDSIESQAVAIVSETLAHRLWPNGDVIGSTVVVNDRPRIVVGVIKDMPLQSRAEALRPYVYTPYWQNGAQVDARLCVRVKGDPTAVLPTLRHEVHQVDPDVPIAETITLPLQMAGIFRPLRMSAMCVGYAGGLTLLLSVIGLYGALAFAVSRRRKEIGIRMALGAEPGRVLAEVVAEGMTVVILGVVLGSCLAVGVTRVVKHLLYATSASDASFHAIAALVVIISGLLACWVPARRAAGLDPVEALKE